MRFRAGGRPRVLSACPVARRFLAKIPSHQSATDRLHRRPEYRGFTLVELLVVISVIALLVGLLLPAVQSAREAARRASCANNLKQLALALQNYESTVAAYPMSQFWKPDPSGMTAASTGYGFLIHLLPYIEQKATYDSFNMVLAFGNVENTTVHGVGISTLWCPSDGTASSPISTTDPLFNPANASPFNVQLSSYAANVGSWFTVTPYPWVNVTSWGGAPNPLYSQVLANYNGVMYHESRVGNSAISDGCSNTFLLGERARGLFAPQQRDTWLWWVSGLRTEFTALYPPNSIRSQPDFSPPGYGSRVVGGKVTSHLVSASSLHPGGCNFAFADGSVRFIKDTVGSWSNDPANGGLPPGITVDPLTGRLISSGIARPGIYQALSTRAGNDVAAELD